MPLSDAFVMLQPTIIKPGSALNVTRPAGALLPFQADVHSFAPKIQDLASALYGLPYGSPPAFYQGLPAAQGVDPAALYNSLVSDLKSAMLSGCTLRHILYSFLMTIL